MDIDREDFGDAALDMPGEMRPFLAPERVADPVCLDRLEPLEVEERHQEVRAGGIAVADREQIGPGRGQHVRPGVQHLGDDGGERLAADLGVGQLAR